MTKKHPDIHIKGRTIDVSDLIADPVVYYNKKFYVVLFMVWRFLVPMVLYRYFVGHLLDNVELLAAILTQYVFVLHIVWFINSAAHMIGDRPYNPDIQPRNNIFIGIFGLHEGFHNYHHSFPWDYRIAENGFRWYDPGKWTIDLGAKLGFISDRKVASGDLVDKTKKKVESQKHDEMRFYLDDHPYVKPLKYSL